MSFTLRFLGATGQVTGSLYLLTAGPHTLLVECGLVQGHRDEESRNRDPFPFDASRIDAVVLSHSHIDHSGRLPKLVREGYTGPIYTHAASLALCDIMLPDAGYLNEKDAEWENRRYHNGAAVVKPLYTRDDASAALRQFVGLEYGDPKEILPGLTLVLHDAGHILGSAIVELRWQDGGGRGGEPRTLVFSGDLGYREAPLMNPATRLSHADVVLMESTYGDRRHRPMAATIAELTEVFASARAARGNVLVPAFTVGRTQDLLHLMAENFETWGLGNWRILLDSPMGIAATEAYARYEHLYAGQLFAAGTGKPRLPNLYALRTAEDSMAVNEMDSGAIIIAGSGMCTGGRILHHLKHNAWRPQCHIVIVGYQAEGTLGRRLVDGAAEISLWGETIGVHATVHTVGGLSAHADQQDLVDWYAGFEARPPVYLVHGEAKAQRPLCERLHRELGAPAQIAAYDQHLVIGPSRAAGRDPR